MTDDQRQARLRHHMYETNEGIQQHAERIVALEELCADLIEECPCDGLCTQAYGDGGCRLIDRAVDLGVLS